MTESATAALTGVGQELAAAREARGLALADVAQQLKFAPRQLEALEQEQFSALPGATFARGMVRSYARLLKLDPDPLVERIAGRFEVPDSNRLAARYHQPVPFSDSARKSTFVYLGLSLGVLVLVGAVGYEWHQERQAAAKSKGSAVAKAAPKERETKPRAAPVPAQVAVAPAPVPAAPAAPVPVAPEKSKPVTVAAAPPAVVAPEKPKPVAQDKDKDKDKEKPKVASSGPHRLVVRTEGEAWIEIKDAADRMLVSSLNPPGSERVVRGKPPYSLVIGNASNVRVLYDDKPIDLAPHTRQDVARLTVP
ncbi:MAG TPA: helix-turn-helix domain-containing protein [Burkholderiales bacterium]|nr:helix-turn-helix domain-containing protein [Burkholderiales bacterium]